MNLDFSYQKLDASIKVYCLVLHDTRKFVCSIFITIGKICFHRFFNEVKLFDTMVIQIKVFTKLIFCHN